MECGTFDFGTAATHSANARPSSISVGTGAPEWIAATPVQQQFASKYFEDFGLELDCEFAASSQCECALVATASAEAPTPVGTAITAPLKRFVRKHNKSTMATFFMRQF